MTTPPSDSDAAPERLLPRFDLNQDFGTGAFRRRVRLRHRTGVVVTSIAHRDQARVYVKQLHHGSSEVELSPEEQEAVDNAMAGAPAGT